VRRAAPWLGATTFLVVFGAAVAIAVLLPSCSSGPSPVVIGSKNFTEQVLLGELLAQVLEARGVPVERRLNLGGSFICHQALQTGNLDMYVEYTGTALTAILKQPFEQDRNEAYARVRAAYEEQYGLAWSRPLGFENTFALIVRPSYAERLGIHAISDVQDHRDTIRFGSGHEFLEREDGYRGLSQAYQLELAIPPRGMELGLVYQALVEEQVDVVVGNSTDGLIDKFGLLVLEDDRRFFPPYDAAIVYRPDAVERHPVVEQALHSLEGSIDESTMRALNARVDDEGRAPSAVVEDFLESSGLGSP
jgi:glycine betaine/choline ABC-type transport system substrate-binding protein